MKRNHYENSLLKNLVLQFTGNIENGRIVEKKCARMRREFLHYRHSKIYYKSIATKLAMLAHES